MESRVQVLPRLTRAAIAILGLGIILSLGISADSEASPLLDTPGQEQATERDNSDRDERPSLETSSKGSDAVASVTTTATPPPSCGLDADYVVITQTVTFAPGGTFLAPTNCDECRTTINLPFAFTLYGQSFITATLGDNGVVAFGANPNTASNICLPRATFSDAIMAHWDDLDMRPTTGQGLGIYELVSGTAPNRAYRLEWRACRYGTACNDHVNFAVTLYENPASGFDIAYGEVGNTGNSATTGVQRGTGAQVTQFSCNNGGLANDLLLQFRQPQCPTATQTHTATATNTATWTPTVTGTPPTSTPTSTAPAPTATATACGGGAPGPWTPAAVVPANLVRYAFTQVGTDFYIFGGVADGLVVQTTYRFYSTSNVWNTLASSPVSAGEAPAAAYWSGKIYLAPGDGQTAFQIYDIATNSWSNGPAFPGAGYGSAAGAANGKVFVVGGNPGTGNTQTWIFDIAANTWSAGTAAPAGYGLGGYQQVGNYLYMVGSYGSNPAGNTKDLSSVLSGKGKTPNLEAPLANGTTTMRLDMSSAPGAFTIGPLWTPARADFGLSYDVANNKLIAIGGDSSGGGYFDSTQAVDELSLGSWPAGTWTASPPNLSSPRQANQAGFYSTGRVWSTGGINGSTFQFLNEHLYRSTGGGGCGTAGTATPTVPTPVPTNTIGSTATFTPTPTPSRTPSLTPTPAPPCGDNAKYVASTATSVPFEPAGEFVAGSRCDDCMLTPVIPFPYRLYGQTYNQVEISSNGTLQFGIASPTPDPRRSCDPAEMLQNSILGYWDNLDMSDPTNPDLGIYTSTNGIAPHRTFDIEWRAYIAGTAALTNFMIRLYEDQSRFDVIYNMTPNSGANTTVGLRGLVAVLNTFVCEPHITPGLMYSFVQPQCPAASVTPTALTPGPTTSGTVSVTLTATFTTTPTSTATFTGTPSPTGSVSPTACLIAFEDVPNGSTFYPFVRCLACRNIVSGYACGGAGEPCVPPGNNPYFRPSNNVTRGQIAKVVANAANLTGPVSGQTFEDVPPGSTFYDFIERLVALGVMNGYQCGGPGEPCVAPNDRPYFRPGGTASRGQVAKIVANAAGLGDPITGQTFEDVPPGSTFYDFIERLVALGVMNGYPCGGAGEPCVPPANRPYFRPSNNVTRGQTSKIVANTFFPGCAPPALH